MTTIKTKQAELLMDAAPRLLAFAACLWECTEAGSVEEWMVLRSRVRDRLGESVPREPGEWTREQARAYVLEHAREIVEYLGRGEVVS